MPLGRRRRRQGWAGSQAAAPGVPQITLPTPTTEELQRAVAGLLAAQAARLLPGSSSHPTPQGTLSKGTKTLAQVASNTTAAKGQGKEKGTPSWTRTTLNTPAAPGTPVVQMPQWGNPTGLYGSWPTEIMLEGYILQDGMATPFFGTPGYPGKMYPQGQVMALSYGMYQPGQG